MGVPVARATGTQLRSLIGATFRASRAFELGSHGPGINGNGRATNESTYVGVLKPIAKRWLGVRAVDAVAAELFRSVAKPKRISPALLRMLGRERNRVLATFVLDGILDIESRHGFVTGADAHHVIVSRSVDMARATSATARLSLSALRHAIALPIDDAEELASKLYFYNRRPVTPQWRERLTDPGAVEGFLRIGPGSRTRALMDRLWSAHDAPAEIDGWNAWSPVAHPARGRTTDGTFKVFISPAPEQAADAVEALVDALAACGPAPFKVPAGPYALMRPDKIVVYFNDRAAMTAFIRTVRPRLAGLRAHGVPFSADITRDGLLSWGLDPVDSALPWSTVNTQSWRIAVTSRLARSLILARHAMTPNVDGVCFALDRLSLDPVDVRSWTPRTR